jgi:hypothetical protein
VLIFTIDCGHTRAYTVLTLINEVEAMAFYDADRPAWIMNDRTVINRLANKSQKEIEDIICNQGLLYIFVEHKKEEQKEKLFNRMFFLLSYIPLFSIYFCSWLVRGDNSIYQWRRKYKWLDKWLNLCGIFDPY